MIFRFHLETNVVMTNLNNVRACISQYLPQDISQFDCLLCGSAVFEETPRDIDLIIIAYESFFPELESSIRNKTEEKGMIVHWHYIEELSMSTMKFYHQTIEYSLHIVSKEVMNVYVEQSSQVSSFVNVNMFDFSLSLPVVYRTWIDETIHIYGNCLIGDMLKSKLKLTCVRSSYVKEVLDGKIKNAIHYYFEKIGNGLIVQQILLMEILNLLILYCYASNNQYIRTIKYIERDLLSFPQKHDLCVACIKLILCNTQDEEVRNDMLKQIISIL